MAAQKGEAAPKSSTGNERRARHRAPPSRKARMLRQRSRIHESASFVMAGLAPAIHVVQFKKAGRFAENPLQHWIKLW